MIRIFSITILCVLFAVGQGTAKGAAKPEATDTAASLLSIYWAGTKSLAGKPDTAGLFSLLSLNESQALKKATLDKLVRRLPAEMGLSRSNEIRTASELLRKPLDELLTTPFLLRCANHNEWTLAVRQQSVAGAQLESALRLLTDRIGRRIAGHGKTWAFLCNESGRVCRVSRTNGWHVFQLGHKDSLLFDPEQSRRQLTRGATNPVLLSVNFKPGTSSADSKSVSSGLPAINLKITTQAGRLRTEGRAQFAGMEELKLDSFQIPTNSLRDPLISITAARGFRDLLGALSALKPWRFKELPNQFFMWARGDIPFQTLITAPIPQATKVIDQLTPRALHVLSSNLTSLGMGYLLHMTNRHELVWRGFPILVPFLAPGAEPGDGWILAGTMSGIVPKGENRTLPPQELFDLITNRTGLVLYDWEITQKRLQHLRGTSQLILMASPLDYTLGGGFAHQWLTAIEGKLGNTATEIIQTSPGEFKLVRNSHLGLSALELIFLGYWLDNPDFPALNYPKPSRPNLPRLPGLPAPG